MVNLKLKKDSSLSQLKLKRQDADLLNQYRGDIPLYDFLNIVLDVMSDYNWMTQCNYDLTSYLQVRGKYCAQYIICFD